METNTKNPINNSLRQYRKRTGLGHKQVAFLFGRKGSSGMSHYESSVQNPSVKTALKFEIIYQAPIRLLYKELFDECRNEIDQRKKSGSGVLTKEFRFPTHAERLMGEQYCYYSELLKGHIPSPAEVEIITHHTISLMRVLQDYNNDKRPFGDIH